MTHIPDDEALSAHLDGEADGETAEHVRTCAVCEARLGELSAAADAVAAAVLPPPETDRAAAVRAALETGDGEAPSTRRRLPTWVVAAAAAIVLVLAAAPVVLSARDGDEVAQRTTSDAFTSGAESGAAEFAPPEELGAQSDPQALARLLDERMRAPRPVPSGALAAQAAKDGDREGAAEGGRGGDDAAGAGSTGPPCLDAARETGAKRVGPLLYTALLEWQATPAVVHVFQAPDPKATILTRRAFVMARSDCQLLVAPSF